ncbi:MAG: hypothetical protein HW414_1673 [Dehalococcoidia bacterium]|nr:hypothetical protein [Dehalococcoidia bacterium]
MLRDCRLPMALPFVVRLSNHSGAECVMLALRQAQGERKAEDYPLLCCEMVLVR